MDQLNSNYQTDMRRTPIVVGRFINHKNNHVLKMVESIPKTKDNRGPTKKSTQYVLLHPHIPWQVGGIHFLFIKSDSEI
jgi:hypothetical protein